MAKLVSKTLSFPPSGSPDVTGYKLYYEPTPGPVTYNSTSIDLGTATTINLSTILPVGINGIYDIGVSAYDAAGNESDLSLSASVPLDLVAPLPPGVLTIQ